MSQHSIQPSLRQVNTLWEYVDQNRTTLRAFLPGDVVQLSLQVKTTQGMHNIRRDAWGGHSHSFKKWGSQIQPTGSTRAKISKFREQWHQYQTQLAEQVNAANRRPTTPPGRRQGPGQLRVNPAPRQFPYFLRRVLAGHPSTIPVHTPTPVAEPLSQMAQLAAGMLPLQQPGNKAITQPRPGTPRPQRMDPTPIEITPTPSRCSSIPPLHTSPISSDDEVPPLVHVNQTQVKKEPQETRNLSTPGQGLSTLASAKETQDRGDPRQEDPPCEARASLDKDTPASDEEDPDVEPHLLPKMTKVRSIPLEMFNQMDTDCPPNVDKVMLSGEGEDILPQRVEEDMDTSPAPTYSTRVRLTLKKKKTPPVEARVRMAKNDVDVSTSEEEVVEVESKNPPRRRQKRKGGLFLRINKMEMGPNNLEIYRVTENSTLDPPTPMSPPEQLFPGGPMSPNKEA